MRDLCGRFIVTARTEGHITIMDLVPCLGRKLVDDKLIPFVIFGLVELPFHFPFCFVLLLGTVEVVEIFVPTRVGILVIMSFSFVYGVSVRDKNKVILIFG